MAATTGSASPTATAKLTRQAGWRCRRASTRTGTSRLRWPPWARKTGTTTMASAPWAARRSAASSRVGLRNSRKASSTPRVGLRAAIRARTRSMGPAHCGSRAPWPNRISPCFILVPTPSPALRPAVSCAAQSQPSRPAMLRLLRHLSLCASLLALPLATLAAPRVNPVPGGIIEVLVAPADEPRPQVLFGERPTVVTAGPGGWRALVGLPLDLSPGPQQIAVLHGDGRRTSEAFTVIAKEYPEQQLHIKDSKMVEPDAASLARIEAEQRIQDEVKTRWRDVAAMDLELIAPSSGRLSSRFGLRRVINGQPRAPHRGLDLAVPTGTPVRSPSGGTVSYVGDFFFNGRTVFVDHGQGLISMICHLDQVEVSEGQELRPGQRLGLSGASGRATGPHVHWTVFLNGTAVDPELFLPPIR